MARFKLGDGITFEAKLPETTKRVEISLSQKQINVLLFIGLIVTNLLHFI